MEKKNGSKFKGVLKYIAKTISLTALIIVIIFGLALLFVFISAKVAKSNNAEPPVNLYTIISPSMTPNISVDDVVVTVKTDPSKLKVRDVISYYTNNPDVHGLTVTHRIVRIEPQGNSFIFQTKGDFNPKADNWVIESKDIVGKVYFKIPQLGKVQFFLGSKGGWLIAILIPALGIIAYDIYKIIKLVLIKQKIAAYQQQEDLPQNEPVSIGTIDEMYKEEKEEIVNIDTSNEVDNSYESSSEMVNKLDEEISKINEWASKIDDENNKN